MALRQGLRPALTILLLLAGAALAACSYRGDIDNPTTLKATWLSYLNGDDIRADCADNRRLHYRVIYNADYDAQVRSYEVIAGEAAGAGTATLISRVQGPSGLVFNKHSLSDPLASVRWTKSVTDLSAEQLSRLDVALMQSGAFDPAPKGLQLFSKETYWISNLCRDGVFSFSAWRFPSDRFDDVLFALDETGVAVRAPVAVPVGASARANVPRLRESDDARGNYFNVKVGENGLTSRLTF